MITIALSKGRIFDETVPLLAAAGVATQDDPETSRKLILGTNRADVRVVIVRATDVRRTCSTALPTSASRARTCCENTAVRDCISRSISASALPHGRRCRRGFD